MLQIEKLDEHIDYFKVAQLCNDGQLPKVAGRIVAALRKAATEGSI